MDPLTAASAFATIVSLIGTYRAERRAGEQDSYNDFLAWLGTSRNKQVVELLATNSQATQAIKDLLTRQHGEVEESFSELSKMISDLAARFDLFEPLAHALHVQSSLSEQSILILRQLNEQKASRFIEVTIQSGNEYIAMDGQQGELALAEGRFIEDDLNKLCEYGLLHLDYNDNDSRIFYITRAGAKLGS